MKKTARRRAYEWGRTAEWLAIIILWCKNYQLVAWRAQSRWGEIDIIAIHKNILVFIEVKAHKNRQQALDAVTPGKIFRLQRAAQAFVAAHPKYAGHDQRFDLMLVQPWRWHQQLHNIIS